MDRNFARALALVLKSEGGWSDHPSDPGGATMKGVTLANFRRYVKADATKNDLRHITDAQVATVYRRFYWDAVAGAELPDGVDYATFDFAVNSGPSRAAKYLQGVLGVIQDGRIGPATIKAAGARPAAQTVNALCDARLAFLKRLSTWGTFGKGWNSRVSSVRAASLAMAQQPTPAKPSPISPPTVDQPTVVTKETGPVVVQPQKDATVVVVPDKPVTPPSIPKTRNGFVVLVAFIVAAGAAFLRYFFGG
ncbi:glycoside hydrolase family 108 protein [Mesorhizobium sp. IMUNJ 23033]|uniref:glycoside hydrolase family 108 protein n=1 Tax=Mesorhizobium sp. IMUNJ 23033 TaxID=3378039 RepID=UPI00384B84D9